MHGVVADSDGVGEEEAHRRDVREEEEEEKEEEEEDDDDDDCWLTDRFGPDLLCPFPPMGLDRNSAPFPCLSQLR